MGNGTNDSSSTENDLRCDGTSPRLVQLVNAAITVGAVPDDRQDQLDLGPAPVRAPDGIDTPPLQRRAALRAPVPPTGSADQGDAPPRHPSWPCRACCSASAIVPRSRR